VKAATLVRDELRNDEMEVVRLLRGDSKIVQRHRRIDDLRLAPVMGPDALPHEFRVGDEVGDAPGRAPVELAHAGHDLIEDQPPHRAADFGALAVILLHIP
jgi:hypothetical protein